MIDTSRTQYGAPMGRWGARGRRPGLCVTRFGHHAGVVLAAVALFSIGTPGRGRADSDPEAVALAESVLEAMGGAEAWAKTRFIRWRFFGRRLHHWDRERGDVRIESESRLVLMNLWSKEGRVWEAGEPLEGAARRDALDEGYAWWVNDSYWLLMPYKLLDPGVNLSYRGESVLADGRAADLLRVTFEADVGLTPQNAYDVWVARDSGLVEQWAYYPTTGEAEPAFTLPWGGWSRFGDVLLATEHGRGADWEIAVPDTMPRAPFEVP